MKTKEQEVTNKLPAVSPDADEVVSQNDHRIFGAITAIYKAELVCSSRRD